MKVVSQAVNRVLRMSTATPSQTRTMAPGGPVDTVDLRSAAAPKKQWDAVAQGCLAVGLLATVAAVPVPAWGQAVGPQTSCIQVDAKCQQFYQSLPAPAQKAFQQIPTGAKGMVARKLQGQTRLMGMKVNNRTAFVEGNVMGLDTFSLISDRLNSMQQEGRLPRNQLEAVQSFLNVSRRLTARQRETLLDLIVRDAK